MSANASASSRVRSTSRWQGEPRRVLVLDDDGLLIRAVSRSLRAVGLTVETTTIPEEALESARRDPPHVVVSDLHMPLACGAEVLTAMTTLAPSAIRVLLSADPELVPERGSLAEARLHALMRKSDMSELAALVTAQLAGRAEMPEGVAEREILAKRVAGALARPSHEDDAHRERLARWTARIATELGASDEEAAAARLGAILHDVGQVTIRDVVFRRNGPLASGERAELARHPEAGIRIVGEMPALAPALEVIAMHHERQDGAGYPAGLVGSAIPRGVLAFQVADAYDAITSGRRHRPARGHAEAVAALESSAGQHHHVDAVRALAAIGEAGLAAALVE